MVGDNLIADVRGAQKADLYGIWISRRADKSAKIPEPVEPDASLSALSELSSALDRLQVS
jgi:FMN phosphatase YigB (HAD superfamily)